MSEETIIIPEATPEVVPTVEIVVEAAPVTE